MPLKVERMIIKIAKEFEAIQKKKQRKNANLDYSNFFKRDPESVYAYDHSCTKSRQKLLAKFLLQEVKS